MDDLPLGHPADDPTDEQLARGRAAVDQRVARHRARRRLAIGGGTLAALALVAVVAWPRSDDGGQQLAAGPSTSTTAGPADGGAGANQASDADAEVRVRLEPIDGFFDEGFEVGLRFEGAGGEVIGTTLWTDFVTAAGGAELRDFYDRVLTQPVPAGPVTVRAEVNIGAGPPPSIPDVDGPLPCSLDLEVVAGQTVDVEVLFDADTECLRLLDPDVDPEATTSTTLPDGITTTTAAGEPANPSTTTTAPQGATTTTTAAVPPEGPFGEQLPAGSEHYVDVDLECEAFDLGGTWVLVSGDPRSWQPAGERHEGGTFTIDAAGAGTFRGDAAGTKVATFRLLPADDPPTCQPVPR